MASYSSERKQAILKKLLPPQSMIVAELARQEGISANTLYHWRDQARKLGLPVPGKTSSTEDWSAETKLAVIVETAALSESELSQYCREKGLYPEQLKRWRAGCLTRFKTSKTQDQEARKQAKIDKTEIKSLKKDLRIKEKALAEAAALLILRKKLRAFWGEDDEES
jgi:transposase-like protein